MTEINRAPLIMCDICGIQEEKPIDGKVNGRYLHKRPPAWGHIRSSPVCWGAYPDNIDLLDCCPECIKSAHAAVSEVIKKRKAKP